MTHSGIANHQPQLVHIVILVIVVVFVVVVVIIVVVVLVLVHNIPNCSVCHWTATHYRCSSCGGGGGSSSNSSGCGCRKLSQTYLSVTEVLVLHPLLEDRGSITESICILVPVDRMKQKCFQITTKWVRQSQQFQLCR